MLAELKSALIQHIPDLADHIVNPRILCFSNSIALAVKVFNKLKYTISDKIDDGEVHISLDGVN